MSQVSLRLRELGGGSQALDGVVSINKQANRMCIRIPGKTQAILTQFEEKRDFNVAICMLQKAGFSISEAIPTSLLSALPSANNVTPDTSLDLGPRLSSITPLSLLPPNNVQGSEAQPSASFTEMLNTPYQDIPVSFMPTPDVLHTQRTHSLPMPPPAAANQMMETVPSRVQLNPYNMFLGHGNNHTHMPRVGSPLRHSFNPRPTPRQSFYEKIVARSYQTTSPPGFRPDSPTVHATYEISSNASTPDRSQMTAIETSKSEANLKNDSSPKSNHHQPPPGVLNEFRSLMPRPRKLPFGSSVKKAILNEPSGARANTQENSDGGPKQKKSRNHTTPNVEAEVMPKHPDIQVRSPNMVHTVRAQNTDVRSAMTSTMKPKINVYRDADCQTDVPTTAKKPENPFEASELKTQFTGPRSSSWIVVTDTGALKDLDQATTSLFEQYETDVANGGDEKLCAEFYMNQIWMKRKEVWLRKLQGMTAGQWHCPTDGYSFVLDSAAADHLH
ncbi:hypothetical protein FSARC_969 [Fusarium sarcochroum]|uniref:Uncharacterized protein n=1 Tax=Fusarium sarcochroum TaxID=1208366 RepID=A0A8H4UAC2_9HYPO|nr:hypothetical protein FSARC_969 [Fusarium sarcochroum]